MNVGSYLSRAAQSYPDSLGIVYKDKGGSNRAVTALTVRIALSVLVFLILMASFYFGWIPERGL